MKIKKEPWNYKLTVKLLNLARMLPGVGYFFNF